MGDVYIGKVIMRDKEISKYSSHTGDLVIFHKEAPNGFAIEEIYAASPTTANFNAAPNGSLLINTTAWTTYRKTGSTTWALITQV
jgi:hypothetical protein